MALNLPSLSDLRTSFRANFAARLPGFDANVRRSVAGVISDMLAGACYPFLRALQWVASQTFIATAEAPYLDRRAGEYGIARVQATAASGSAAFTGTAGAIVPANLVLQTQDGSLAFTLSAAVTLGAGGTGSGTVVCNTAGAAGDLAAGTVLDLVTAVSNVAATAAVGAGGLTGGADAESDASLRERGLARIQNPPQGGSGADFYSWARASGVPTRAWVYPNNRGVGTCDVAIAVDTATGPVPTAGEVATVQSYVQTAAPVIGSYEVFAPTADALAITIANLSPTSMAIQSAIIAALQALAATVPPGGATFGDAVTVALQNGALFPLQTPGTLYLEQIHAAIQSAATLAHYDLTAPTADVSFAAGHLPAIPTITFV